MSRNLSRINNYYQRLQAARDWLYVASRAHAQGRADLVVKYAPNQRAGVKTIDKSIDALRAEFGWPEVYLMREQDKVQPC